MKFRRGNYQAFTVAYQIIRADGPTSCEEVSMVEDKEKFLTEISLINCKYGRSIGKYFEPIEIHGVHGVHIK